MEDIFEATVGAIIQDFGDEDVYRYEKRFLLKIVEHIVDFSEIILHNENFKDTLQRYFQSLKWPNPTYIDLEETGPSHLRQFSKGIFLKKELLHQLSSEVVEQAEGYSRDVLRTSQAKLRGIIEDYCRENDCVLLGIASANKKAQAEQQASSIALCNLSISFNW
jgi:dsRNA-specific ribonuclease